jgi:L-xylulokinase
VSIPLFLCIDCGLTDTKAVIIDATGRECARARVATEVCTRGDTNEIDMAAQWQKTARVMREALRDAGVASGGIACVGASGHGGGLYPVDARGEPVCHAFTSMDGRSRGTLDTLRRNGASCYPLTRHHPWSGQPTGQLRWLKDNRRDLYDRIRWMLGAKDWVNFNLTGKASADYTDASNDGLLNLHTRSYDPRILEAFGIPEMAGKLPPLRGSSEIVGAVSRRAAAETGLAAGTPVVGGLFDVIACALGSGVHDARAHSIIAGTWNINTSLEDRLVQTPPSVKCSLSADGTRYAYVESSATSAGNLEWFLRKVLRGFPAGGNATDPRGAPADPHRERADSSFDPVDPYRAVNDAVASIGPRESQVIYLPFLYPSHLSLTMEAGFLGLRAEHGSAHMLRAIFEGVAFAHRQHLEILAAHGLGRPRAVLSGGAANSAIWAAMFADVTGLLVETTDTSQAGAMGVAACAAKGTGMYGSLEDAVGTMVRTRGRHLPDPSARAAYDEKYRRYLDIIRLFDTRRDT